MPGSLRSKCSWVSSGDRVSSGSLVYSGSLGCKKETGMALCEAKLTWGGIVPVPASKGEGHIAPGPLAIGRPTKLISPHWFYRPSHVLVLASYPSFTLTTLYYDSTSHLRAKLGDHLTYRSYNGTWSYSIYIDHGFALYKEQDYFDLPPMSHPVYIDHYHTNGSTVTYVTITI
uniref:Uncharacterized protein n=1 Tax=Chytriomyces confervae TaxID=246404 RepID=A0A4P8NPP3_9FUNG|nr:hypothetical protein [Chytriomyces confervae]QCQ69062.1 hypothetical protein [Chytriomyces confervae]